MKEVRVHRTELLNVLKENLGTHQKVFEEAEKPEFAKLGIVEVNQPDAGTSILLLYMGRSRVR